MSWSVTASAFCQARFIAGLAARFRDWAPFERLARRVPAAPVRGDPDCDRSIIEGVREEDEDSFESEAGGVVGDWVEGGTMEVFFAFSSMGCQSVGYVRGLADIDEIAY